MGLALANLTLVSCHECDIILILMVGNYRLEECGALFNEPEHNSMTICRSGGALYRIYIIVATLYLLLIKCTLNSSVLAKQ